MHIEFYVLRYIWGQIVSFLCIELDEAGKHIFFISYHLPDINGKNFILFSHCFLIFKKTSLEEYFYICFLAHRIEIH